MSELTKQYSQNYLNTDSFDFFARALSKEILTINNHPFFKAFNTKTNELYSINTYVYDPEKIDKKTQKELKELIGEDSFCMFNERANCYEIYLSIYSNKLLDELLNKQKITFRNKTLDFMANPLLLRKEILLSTYRHELAHIKISDMKNDNKAFDYVKDNKIPFEIFNILEDVRVNTFWDYDYDNFRVIFNELYKADLNLLGADKTLGDIFFQVCITLDDEKYTYNSPDYPFIKDIFNRTKKAMSSYEVAQLSKELYDKIKNNTQPQLNLTNNASAPATNEMPNDDNSQSNNNPSEKNNTPNTKQPFDDLFGDEEGQNLFDFDDIFNSSEDFEAGKDNQASEKSETKQFGKGDLLSPEDAKKIIDSLEKIKITSYHIDDAGAITPPDRKKIQILYDLDRELTRSYSSFNLLNDNKQTTLSSKLLKEIETLIRRKLEKESVGIFSTTDEIAGDLNEDNLYTLPTNPFLDDLFIEKKQIKNLQTPNFVFFCDLSGSMTGTPLLISQYVLASLEQLTKQKVLNAKVVLHCSHEGKSVVNVIDPKKEHNYLNKIGNLITYDDESFCEAVSYVKKTINEDVKKARAIFFLSDCNICNHPVAVKKSLATLDNDRIYAIYPDYDKHSANSIFTYFDKGLTLKNADFGLNDLVKKIVESIITISNKEINNENAVKLLSKDNDLIVYENPANTIKELKKRYAKKLSM